MFYIYSNVLQYHFCLRSYFMNLGLSLMPFLTFNLNAHFYFALLYWQLWMEFTQLFLLFEIGMKLTLLLNKTQHFDFRYQFYVFCHLFLYPLASLPFVIMNIAARPYERGIYCQDESIGYPLRPDTITHVTLAVVSITCTVIIVSAASIIASTISHEQSQNATEICYILVLNCLRMAFNVDFKAARQSASH